MRMGVRTRRRFATAVGLAAGSGTIGRSGGEGASWKGWRLPFSSSGCARCARWRESGCEMYHYTEVNWYPGGVDGYLAGEKMQSVTFAGCMSHERARAWARSMGLPAEGYGLSVMGYAVQL